MRHPGDFSARNSLLIHLGIYVDNPTPLNAHVFFSEYLYDGLENIQQVRKHHDYNAYSDDINDIFEEIYKCAQLWEKKKPVEKKLKKIHDAIKRLQLDQPQ
ncbi:MAG TPA: hypothetical protein VK158_01675 [Acidobacteriota bacterium]|nr:hypothetical protein [Acidobacteriota bacterium]